MRKDTFRHPKIRVFHLHNEHRRTSCFCCTSTNHKWRFKFVVKVYYLFWKCLNYENYTLVKCELSRSNVLIDISRSQERRQNSKTFHFLHVFKTAFWGHFSKITVVKVFITEHATKLLLAADLKHCCQFVFLSANIVATPLLSSMYSWHFGWVRSVLHDILNWKCLN
jgi:hypothetical protein